MVLKERYWSIRSTSELGLSYSVIFIDPSFTCTCPNFQFWGNQCKHIKKVKMLLAGEKQKNKLTEEVV